MPLRVSLVNLQKFTFQRVARQPKHVDVGARAEHALFRAGDDHALHFGMLEADAVERVVQLDVHAQVVGVELELVAGHDAAVLVDIHGQRRNCPSKVRRQCT